MLGWAMKKIGIVGGVAWLSTVDYYAGICRRSEQEHADAGRQGIAPMPEMSIESLDLDKALSYLGTEGDECSWSLFDAYHRDALKRLEVIGVDFAVIASNTPHHRFAAIMRDVNIPVIDLFKVVAEEAVSVGATQVLILGTALTMASERLRRAFANKGVDADGPIEHRNRLATIELIAQLQRGVIDGAAERIERIAKTSFPKQCAARPVVCLACTELVLAFPEFKSLSRFKMDGVTYINSSAAHIDAAVSFARDGADR
jgi:aspartate racemase